MYIVRRTVYIVSALNIVLRTLYDSVRRTLYVVHCTSYNVRRRVYYGQCDSRQSYKDYNGVSRTLYDVFAMYWSGIRSGFLGLVLGVVFSSGVGSVI